jgi:hypothetical protein
MAGGVVDWSGLSRLGTGLAAGLEDERKQGLAQLMGAQVQAGDYKGAAGLAFKAGDLSTGLQLAKLGDAREQTADFNRQLAAGGGLAAALGGGPVDAGTGTPQTVAPVAAPKLSGPAESKAQTIVSGLIKRGIDPKVAAGLAGNFLIESSFDNTNGTGDNGTAFGLGQWRNERFKALQATAGQRGWQDIEAQLDHTANELKGSHKGAYDAALAAPDASSAAVALMNKFEIPSRAAAAESGPRRAAAAARFYSQFGGGQQQTPTNVAGMNPSPQRVQVASADPSFVPQSASPADNAAPAAPQMSVQDDPVAPEQRVQVAQAVPQVFSQAGLNPRAAAQLQATQPGSAARIQTIVKFMSHPGAPEGFKEAMKAALANEYAIDKENRSMTADQKAYNWDVAVGGFKGTPMEWRAAKASAERAPAADPVDIQKYEYSKRQGYTGSLVDFLRTEAEARSTKINNNVNLGAENEQDKVVQKDFGDQQVDTRKAAAQAVTSLANIRAARQIMQDPNFYSGTFGSLATEGKKALASIGLAAADSARANEGFTKISAQSILDKAGGSFGNAFSNSDRDAIKQTAQNIDNTPAGNALILDMAERVAMRAQENHRMMIAYKAANKGRIDDGFQQQLDKYAIENPLFKGLDIHGPAVAAPAAQRPAGAPAPGQRDASAQGLKPAPADEIANARAAIASGKVTTEQVIQKMRSRGFLPAGL